MRRAALLLGLLAVAGCGSGTTIAQRKLPALVLQEQDLGSRFVEFADSAQSSLDAHQGPRFDAKRFGRRAGWISRYRRANATIQTSGPLVVESRADLFGSSGGAKKDLQAYTQEYEAANAKRENVPKLGDASVAFAFGTSQDRFQLVAWRSDNVTGSVLVEGPKVTLADALALARRDLRHFAAAA